MRTKVSLALGPRSPLSRQTAWGCLTTNLAIPGCGSLVAGRPVGYAQLAVTVAGFLLISIFGMKFIVWYLANWKRLRQVPDFDPLAGLDEVWTHVRWALLGFAFAGAALVWALNTSLSILREARPDPPSVKPVPPKL